MCINKRKIDINFRLNIYEKGSLLMADGMLICVTVLSIVKILKCVRLIAIGLAECSLVWKGSTLGNGGKICKNDRYRMEGYFIWKG
jgi:hypothetical protein